MSFAFGEVRPLVDPRLGVEIVDVRSLTGDEESAIRDLYHNGMQAFLKADRTFTFNDTCVNKQACLGALNNAYVDHVDEARKNGTDPLSYESYSRVHFDRLVSDFIPKPHLDLHWFGIRPTGQRAFTGALCITNIEPVKQDSRLLTLCGQPVAYHPPVRGFSQAEMVGGVIRFVMDNNLLTVDPQEPDVDFVEWHLPTHPDSRYIVRGTNTYGRDIFEAMADGVKVRFGDKAVGDAPVEIKRELQPTDNPTRFPDFTKPTRTGGVGGVKPRPLDPPSRPRR